MLQGESGIVIDVCVKIQKFDAEISNTFLLIFNSTNIFLKTNQSKR